MLISEKTKFESVDEKKSVASYKYSNINSERKTEKTAEE
jgi:hypothetical protein